MHAALLVATMSVGMTTDNVKKKNDRNSYSKNLELNLLLFCVHTTHFFSRSMCLRASLQLFIFFKLPHKHATPPTHPLYCTPFFLRRVNASARHSTDIVDALAIVENAIVGRKYHVGSATIFFDLLASRHFVSTLVVATC